MKNYKRLTPFKRCVLQNFPFIEADFDALTNYGLLCKIVEYLNKVISSQNEVQANVEALNNAFIDLKNYVDNFFDNLDVQEEINNKLDEMAESGEFDELIAKYILIAPNGTDFNFKRIGRKIFKSTIANPLAIGMQGGVMIDENTVAYALWDTFDQTTNINRIVVMNINTGAIIRYADYVYGWCNSIAYNDGKLYVAVRGSSVSGESVNNGTIKILDVNTLAEVDEITMNFNVNAIYHAEEGFYILQESSGNVYLYDDSLSERLDTITLEDSNYHQNICVDEHFIYLLSSRPASSLKIYDKTGELVRAINIKKINGKYATGEVQWIDKRGEDLILGSVNIHRLMGIAQFFYTNLRTNVEVEEFVNLYAQTIYCNSDTDYYDADGSTTKPFSEILECEYIGINNIVIEGNNKSYDYVYLSDRTYARIQNATLSNGGYLQYGEYVLQNVKVDYSNNSDITACLYIRNCTFISDNVIYDGDNNSYLIKNGGNCIIHINEGSFTNYTSRIFTGSNATSIINFNNTDNVPYTPRLYNVPYDLCFKERWAAWNTGEYTWNTDLTADQIDDLKNNCTHIIVGVQPINAGDVIEYKFPIRGGDNSVYTINQITSSSQSFNTRTSKTTFKIDKNKMTITGVSVNQILLSNGELVASTPTPASSNTNIIQYIKMINIQK